MLVRAGEAGFTRAPITLSGLDSGLDALLIVPPFARLDMPHLGVHLLEGCARAAGRDVAVLYAGMFLAREVGVEIYHAISESVTPFLLGERIFARAAYDLPILGRDADRLTGFGMAVELGECDAHVVLDEALLRRVAVHVEDWVDRLARAVCALRAPVVGCTTVFEQTAAAVALLRRVKALTPHAITILGGANCAGSMAQGIASLGPAIDHVFSGECESAFPAFLADIARGARPRQRVIDGGLCSDLDSIPTPDYRAYDAQRAAILGDALLPGSRALLPYESSRGCWWGQKHHCTFCAVHAMRYRQKTPGRVLAELGVLVAGSTGRRVHNVDDLMPHTYFKTLLPSLGGKLPNTRFFFNQKSNLTLDKVQTLATAGVDIIQAGVEALSSPLLGRMNKGVLARQNVALLRYTRATGIRLVWNLLHGFPGDSAEDYAQYPVLFPLLRHLSPPQGFWRLQLLRFSPYVMNPERHGVRNLRPIASYAGILPEGADIDRIAYFFDADFPSVVTEAPELVARIDHEVQAWRRAWTEAKDLPPSLLVTPFSDGLFLLTDTRGIAGTLPLRPITEAQAAAALVGRPVGRAGALRDAWEWALEHGCCVKLDSWYIPLATAPPDLLTRFERRYGDSSLLAPSGHGDEALLPPDAIVPAAALRPRRSNAG